MKNVVLFGGSHVANYCIDILRHESKYKIIGIIDSVKDIGSSVSGFRIIGRQEELQDLVSKYNIDAGIISIGDNCSRKAVYDSVMIQLPCFEFVNIIHPSVIIGMNVKIGTGTIILPGCIIGPNTVIGNFCYLGTATHFGHDCNIEDFASISTGSNIGGKVKVGKYCAITLNCTIVDRIAIGDNTVIGSGSLVTKNVPDNVLAYGSPSQIIRTRTFGQKYLKSG